VTRTPFSFNLRQDDLIRGDLWMPAELLPGAAVVVSHGTPELDRAIDLTVAALRGGLREAEE
jgi:hypothetical protein